MDKAPSKKETKKKRGSPVEPAPNEVAQSQSQNTMGYSQSQNTVGYSQSQNTISSSVF